MRSSAEVLKTRRQNYFTSSLTGSELSNRPGEGKSYKAFLIIITAFSIVCLLFFVVVAVSAITGRGTRIANCCLRAQQMTSNDATTHRSSSDKLGTACTQQRSSAPHIQRHKQQHHSQCKETPELPASNSIPLRACRPAFPIPSPCLPLYSAAALMGFCCFSVRRGQACTSCFSPCMRKVCSCSAWPACPMNMRYSPGMSHLSPSLST
jgi:hypothetical protein